MVRRRVDVVFGEGGGVAGLAVVALLFVVVVTAVTYDGERREECRGCIEAGFGKEVVFPAFAVWNPGII